MSKASNILAWMRSKNIRKCRVDGEYYVNHSWVSPESRKEESMKSFGVRFADNTTEYVYAANPKNAATLALARKINVKPDYDFGVRFIQECKPGELNWGPARPEAGTGFVNLFINSVGKMQAGGVYESKEIADAIAQPTRYACVPISWPKPSKIPKGYTPWVVEMTVGIDITKRPDDIVVWK